jgi:hypothetical protein
LAFPPGIKEVIPPIPQIRVGDAPRNGSEKIVITIGNKLTTTNPKTKTQKRKPPDDPQLTPEYY